MPNECTIPGVAEPLEQGDILVSRDPQTGKIIEILLVITADCDISHGKFGSHLACLRIIPLQDYIRTILLDKKLRRLLETESDKVCSVLNKWNTARIPDAVPFSKDAVLDWIRNSEPEAISSDLQVPASDSPKLSQSLRTFRAALQASDALPDSDKLGRLIAFRTAQSGKTPDECLQFYLKQVQGDPLPEDIFLLPELPQLTTGSAVILLRQLVGLPLPSICFRAMDADSASMFLRIGRLEPTFKYAVSQALAIMYSRIGMPEEYEARRDAVIASLTTLQW